MAEPAVSVVLLDCFGEQKALQGENVIARIGPVGSDPETDYPKWMAAIGEVFGDLSELSATVEIRGDAPTNALMLLGRALSSAEEIRMDGVCLRRINCEPEPAVPTEPAGDSHAQSNSRDGVGCLAYLTCEGRPRRDIIHAFSRKLGFGCTHEIRLHGLAELDDYYVADATTGIIPELRTVAQRAHRDYAGEVVFIESALPSVLNVSIGRVILKIFRGIKHVRLLDSSHFPGAVTIYNLETLPPYSSAIEDTTRSLGQLDIDKRPGADR